LIRSLITATVAVVFASFAGAADKDTYRIGAPRSAFRDVPPALVEFAGMPFQDLMKEITGLKGEIVQDTDALTVAKKIDEGKLHMGVLQGHEYAWAKEKYPDLQPLFCSIYRPKEIQAVILVRRDRKATELGDMKGCKLVLSGTLKDHARLYLEKRRADCDGSFCSTEKASTVHEGIQKVIASEADMTVADIADWNHFQKLYPGPSKNVKVLAQSEVFPQTVLVYKKGTLDEATLTKLRDGFLSAHENKKAARLMTTIRIERFDAVPADYDATVAACLKTYPKPLAEK
jgi:ABC-type phosphate/phosphonate transport system substrate-binding protein